MSAAGMHSKLRIAPVPSGLERYAKHIFSLPWEQMPPVCLSIERQARICQEAMLPDFTSDRVAQAKARGWGDASRDPELFKALSLAAITEVRWAGNAFIREFKWETAIAPKRGAPGNSPMIQDFIWALGVLAAWELRERGALRMNGTRVVRAPIYNLAAKLLGPGVSGDTVRRAYEAAERRIAELAVIAELVDGPEEIPELQWDMLRVIAHLSIDRFLVIGSDFVRAEIARGKARDFVAFRARTLAGPCTPQATAEGGR